MSGAQAYPLAWPTGWPRTPWARRIPARFGKKHRDSSGFTNHKQITVAEACDRLQAELDRIGARHAVLSTNLEQKLTGGPRSGQSNPTDPGVCVYFQLKGRPTTLPCDRYDDVAGNIAAVAAHIEATRAIERHGVGTLDQMFTGFQAIRGPGPKPWKEVLGFPTESRPSVDTIRMKQRELAKKFHPDMGGSDALMAEINAAADAALTELRT